MIKKNFIQKEYIKVKLEKKFFNKFEKIFLEIKKNLNNQNKIYSIFSNNYKFNFNLKDLKKFKKYNSIVIIGMGGSILGANAIYEFLKKKVKKVFYFLDNIDIQKINDLRKKLNFKKTVFLIISKSGNTIETLSNALFLNILKKNSQNILIISEKNNNLLFNLSKKLNLFFIEHKKKIGGRFSVLSEVGMVPAYLMNLNISKLRKNIKKNLDLKSKFFLKESSCKLANLLHQNKINSLIYLNYAPQLEKLLFWCQQLIAESLGKNKKGFMPIISNSPKDHHSLLQLYLDGPRDKLFYIFSVDEKLNTKLYTKKTSDKIKYLNNKSLINIRNAQKEAIIQSLKLKRIPFREFKIKELNEETLGELFSYFILETIIIGKLIDINPFDQPAVEQVKVITKKLLS